MANLLVEIGNTALKAAWAEGHTLGKIFRYQGERKTEYIISLTEREKPVVLVVASVYDISASEERRLSRCCTRLVILDGAHKTIAEQYGLPVYLTYDRVASLIAVRSLFSGKDCTLFDFGTTLTTDFIAADGSYRGGSISLGCRTRFKALNRYSKALPLVDTPASEVLPAGDSLASSIEAGVISGIMFEIQGYMDRNPENVTVFTGGDAIYFAKRMKNSIFVICNLVLMGLAIITDEYVEKNNQ